MWLAAFDCKNMANPQKENGYTKIANEILEHFIEPGITSSEFRVVLFIIRKTYGFNKNKDRISLSQFTKATRMNRPQAARTIKSLVSKRILFKENGVYKLNKNWEEWVVSKRIPSIQMDNEGSIQTDNDLVSKRIHTKESIQKKHTKEIAAEPPHPFLLKGELEKLKSDPKRHIQLIGEYLEEKKVPLCSKAELQEAIKRHSRAAVSLSKFTDDRIGWATSVAEKEYPAYTLETLVKILTR